MKLQIRERLSGIKNGVIKRAASWISYLKNPEEELKGEASYLNSYKNILLSSALICYGLAVGLVAIGTLLIVYVFLATIVTGRPDIVINNISLLLKINPLALVILAVFVLSSIFWLGVYSVLLSILQVIGVLFVSILSFILVKLVGGKGSLKAHIYAISIWYPLASIASLAIFLILAAITGSTATVLFALALA
ncbi:MAG: hypothetical protein ABIA67_05850, partial [Candidatus Margulisiibacteriota bacterium]